MSSHTCCCCQYQVCEKFFGRSRLTNSNRLVFLQRLLKGWGGPERLVFLVPDSLHSVISTEVILVHHVRSHSGRRTLHASSAVHQHTLTTLQHRIDGPHHHRKVLEHHVIVARVVVNGYPVLIHTVQPQKRNVLRAIHHKADVVFPEKIRVLRVSFRADPKTLQNLLGREITGHY